MGNRPSFLDTFFFVICLIDLLMGVMLLELIF